MNNLFSFFSNFLFGKKEEEPIKLYNTKDRDIKTVVKKEELVKELEEEEKVFEEENVFEEEKVFEEEVKEEIIYPNDVSAFQEKKKLEEIFEPIKLNVLKELIEKEEINNDLQYEDLSDDSN